MTTESLRDDKDRFVEGQVVQHGSSSNADIGPPLICPLSLTIPAWSKESVLPQHCMTTWIFALEFAGYSLACSYQSAHELVTAWGVE